VIEFEGVSCSRGSTPVLRDFSLAIGDGQTLALVGRSGAGKSTALKLINRMLEPDNGRVMVDGRDTREWNATALRRQTGYMLQEVGLFPHMTVSGNVGLVPALLGWERTRIAARTRELLDLVGLSADRFSERWPSELSGGQRQRVGVARALAADPPVVLMDEPFGALDPVTRSELHDVVRRIQSAVRKTMVLVTHDMREAFVLADRIGVLQDGRLVACETPPVLGRSEHPEVRALLDATVR
jgi:osmoprotectant transport system ATP-binding protein